MQKQDWRERIAEYFTFSLNERWAILVLVMLILFLFIAPGYFSDQEGGPLVINDSLVQKAIGSIDSATVEHHQNKYLKIKTFPKKETQMVRFTFDPNTITTEDWIRLGVKEKTAQTIARYRSKGGRFRTAEDLSKVYGLAPDLFETLKPYVKIVAVPSQYINSNTIFKKKAAAKIRINLSDSLEWEALPGIGPKLASRIINFRKRLGGFYNRSQVGEVYGIPDSLFARIEPFLENDGQPLVLLPVNSATAEELATHPYVTKGIANAIVQYRNAHGRFQQLEDMKRIHLIDHELFEKISRYCTID